MQPLKNEQPAPLLKLDLGCGKNKREGFTGVDAIAFDTVDVQLDIGTSPWPWGDNTVEEAHCSHFVEHLTASQRIHFVNELHRVLIPRGRASVITPHWASNRAYGDLTHQWPPVSEMWFFYLDKTWRATNAPHNTFYTCDFECTWGYGMRPDLIVRNAEFQQWAMANFKEAVQDMHCTMVARK
jgi:hypothetical protein